MENATNIQVLSNDFSWIGGNAVFLSNSVKNSTVSANMFQWLGTSGVAVQGKTGNALMDGRSKIPLATEILLESTDGALHPCSLGSAACYLLFMLTRTILMASLFHRPRW